MLRARLITLALLLAAAAAFVAWLLHRPSGGAWLLAHLPGVQVEAPEGSLMGDFSARRLVLTTLAVVVGAILYRFFIALALNSDFIGLQAQDLNMVTAALVVIALVLPGMRRKVFGKLAKTGTKGN